jgi:imidazolonepropionase-like amidohydrolase
MMRSRIWLTVACFCLWPAASPAQSALVLRGVTVIDGTGAPPLPNRTVIIDGSRIRQIVGADERATRPAGARVVDARGKFVIPGLWDMHVHLTADDLAPLVAYGVTGVRDMGNILSDVDAWRAQVGDGTLVGPRIVRVGPILNGEVFGPTHVKVGSESEARTAVRLLKQVSVDAIKLHKAISRDAYFGLAAEAKQLGIPFVGHVPEAVTLEEASEAGQSSIEHMQTLFERSAPPKREDMPALFARFAKNGNAFTPTLVLFRASADPANIDPGTLKQYPDIPAGRMRIFGQFLELLAGMERAGVTLMTGTDLGIQRWFAPGSSLHDELAIFVQAGLTPMQALQAATLNPARFLGVDAGTIEPGKLADLVLLDANPLDDIRNSRRIRAVIINARYFDRAQLDELLRRRPTPPPPVSRTP